MNKCDKCGEWWTPQCPNCFPKVDELRNKLRLSEDMHAADSEVWKKERNELVYALQELYEVSRMHLKGATVDLAKETLLKWRFSHPSPESK